MKLVGLPKRLTPRLPKEVTPEIREFCRSIGGGDLVRIPIDPKGVAWGCLFNSFALAADIGGNVVRGWEIWELPGVYLCAEDHAVVEKDGIYYDHTPLQDTRQILFLAQNVVTEMTAIRPTHFAPLSKKSQVVRACVKYREGVVRACTQKDGHDDYYSRLCFDQGDALIEAHLKFTSGRKKKRK